MDFELTEEQKILRKTVRDFAEKEIRPITAELDEKQEFSYEIVEKMANLGIMGIPFRTNTEEEGQIIYRMLLPLKNLQE